MSSPWVTLSKKSGLGLQRMTFHTPAVELQKNRGFDPDEH